MRTLVIALLCLVSWLAAPLTEEDSSVLREGDRFAIPTFSEGIIAVEVQADGTLHVETLLLPEAVGSVAVMEALPGGKLAMAGYVTQLLLWDEADDTITALTDFPERGTNWSHLDLTADAQFGLFEALDPVDRMRYVVFTLDLSEESPPIHPLDDMGINPVFSAEGSLLATTRDAPLDTVTRVDLPSQVEIMDFATGETLYVDDRACSGVRFHPIQDQVAYLCQTEDDDLLVIYEIETEARIEYPVRDARCLTWSPEGERVFLMEWSQERDEALYRVLMLETGESVALVVPESLPDFDSLACWTWLFPPAETP